MNGILLRLAAAALLLAAGHALTCYKCDIGIFSVCVTSQQMCAAGEHCYSGVGTAVGVLSVMKKGCLAEKDCNKTSEVSAPGQSNATVYSMTKTCCETDLCNAVAPGPGGSAPLLLATLTSMLVATALV